MLILLTQTCRCQDFSHRNRADFAVGKEGLTYIACERKRHHTERRGTNDQGESPAVQESRKRSEGLVQIRVFGTRFGDHSTHFTVAERTEKREHTAAGPNDQTQTNRAGSLEHACWGDENPGADDHTNDKSNAIEKGYFFFKANRSVVFDCR